MSLMNGPIDGIVDYPDDEPEQWQRPRRALAPAVALGVLAVGLGVGAGVALAHPITSVSSVYALNIPQATQELIAEDQREALDWALDRYRCAEREENIAWMPNACDDVDMNHVTVAFRPDVADLLQPVSASFDLPPVTEWAKLRDSIADRAPARADEVCHSFCGICHSWYVLPERDREEPADWGAVVNAPGGSHEQLEAKAAYLNAVYPTHIRMPEGTSVILVDHMPADESVTVVAAQTTTTRNYIVGVVLGIAAVAAAVWAGVSTRRGLMKKAGAR